MFAPHKKRNDVRWRKCLLALLIILQYTKYIESILCVGQLYVNKTEKIKE